MQAELAADVMRILQPAFAFQPETIAMWAEGIVDLADYEAAMRTAKAMVRDAKDRYVPGFGAFLADYNRWVQRLNEQRGDTYAEHERLAIAAESAGLSHTRFPPFAEGVEIAWREYVKERAHLGLKPDRSHFDAYLGAGRDERRSDPRNQRSIGFHR